MKTTLELILKELKVKYTHLYAEKLHNEHPHKDNLYGISKMLADYGVESAIIDIADKDFKLLKYNSILNFRGHNVLFREWNEQEIKVFWDNREIKIPLEDFNQFWDGKAIFPYKSAKSTEPDYGENLKNQIYNDGRKYLLYFIAAIALMAGFFANKIFMHPGLMVLLAVNTVGIYISFLLMQKQMNIHNDYADKICAVLSKGGCKGILESSAAKLFGLIGWSEVGSSYFISNVSVVIFLPRLLPYLAILNICAIPYSFWSVWYQKFKAKQWCVLCLIVQILLWTVFLTNLLFSHISVPTFKVMDMFWAGLIYLLPFLVISLLSPLLIKNRHIRQLTGIFNKMKAKPEVFSALLMRQPYYDINDSVSEIKWGNEAADTQITVVTNPYCGYCAVMYKRIETLLKKLDDRISVRYIYSGDERTETGCKFLLSVYFNKSLTADQKKEVFNDWYKDSKNRNENFMKKYQGDSVGEIVEREMQKHKQWCTQTNNFATPTIFLNGHKMPENYMIEDILWFFQ